jgi:hypothetical protein
MSFLILKMQSFWPTMVRFRQKMSGDLQEKHALYAKPSLVLLEVGYSRPFSDVGYIIK